MCEGVLPVCVYNICVSSHTLGIHNGIVQCGLPALREVYQGNSNSPSSHFYPSLVSPSTPPSSLHPLPCSLSAGGEIQMCRGDLDRKRRARKREIEIHIPLVTDFIVQDLLDKPLDPYTQTIMHTKQ